MLLSKLRLRCCLISKLLLFVLCSIRQANFFFPYVTVNSKNWKQSYNSQLGEKAWAFLETFSAYMDMLFPQYMLPIEWIHNCLCPPLPLTVFGRDALIYFYFLIFFFSLAIPIPRLRVSVCLSVWNSFDCSNIRTGIGMEVDTEPVWVNQCHLQWIILVCWSLLPCEQQTSSLCLAVVRQYTKFKNTLN